MKNPNVTTAKVLPLHAPESKSSLKQEEILLTPDMAQLFYDERARNRSIQMANLNRLTQAILRGEWRLTHQGLAFNKQGKLLDGQHRCLAVIKSGKAVRIMVTWDLPDQTMDVMDVGAARVAHQQLEIEGVEGARLIQGWANHGRSIILGRREPISTPMLRQFVTENQLAIQWALSLPRKEVLKKNFLLGSLFFAFPKHPKIISKLALDVESGANLDLNSPALIIRNLALGSSDKNSMAGREGGLKILRLCLAAIRGEKITKKYVYATDSTLAEFIDCYPLGTIMRPR